MKKVSFAVISPKNNGKEFVAFSYFNFSKYGKCHRNDKRRKLARLSPFGWGTTLFHRPFFQFLQYGRFVAPTYGQSFAGYFQVFTGIGIQGGEGDNK